MAVTVAAKCLGIKKGRQVFGEHAQDPHAPAVESEKCRATGVRVELRNDPHRNVVWTGCEQILLPEHQPAFSRPLYRDQNAGNLNPAISGEAVATLAFEHTASSLLQQCNLSVQGVRQGLEGLVYFTAFAPWLNFD